MKSIDFLTSALQFYTPILRSSQSKLKFEILPKITLIFVKLPQNLKYKLRRIDPIFCNNIQFKKKKNSNQASKRASMKFCSSPSRFNLKLFHVQ